MIAKFAPVPSAERIILLDVLRGLAIFGILIVNMQIFYRPVTVMLIGYTGSATIADQAGEAFIKFFFEGKFYVLFSMLFGYGFWMFIKRAKPDIRSVLPIFRVRLLVLLLIGAAHAVLLWPGDILVFYSLFGFLLILFIRKQDRALINWAIWLALTPVIITVLSGLMIAMASLTPESAEMVGKTMQEREQTMVIFLNQAINVYSDGTFSEIVTVRLREYLMLLPGILFFYPTVLAMFLVGVWAARRGLLENHSKQLPFFNRALWWGLGAGVVFNAIYTYAWFRAGSLSMPGFWTVVASLFHTSGGISFFIFYVSAVVILFKKGRFALPAEYLAPVGQMALTNYLLQSVICTTIFLPYGFGLFGQITVLQGILISITIFSLQIPLSIYWLRYFNFGPLEWLWRSLTYMTWQPFRKTSILILNKPVEPFPVNIDNPDIGGAKGMPQ
jgi:uncharacterized protein